MTSHRVRTILRGMFAVVKDVFVFILTGFFTCLRTWVPWTQKSSLHWLQRLYRAKLPLTLALLGMWHTASSPPPIICLCIILFVLLITHTLIEIYPGKSTVVKAITGVQTVRFKNELERNITIKLGYANAKLYQVCPENVGASNHLLLSLSLNTMCTSFVVDNQTCRRKEWTKVS